MVKSTMSTLTPFDNDTYQDEMIEDVFSSNNSPRKESQRAMQPSSSRAHKSRSNVSKTSKTGAGRPSSSRSDYNSATDTSPTAVTANRMHEIDEEIHNMVREDVRRMIAKIRSERKKPKEYKKEEKTRDKLMVRPGKYGESDPRVKKNSSKKR